MNQKPHVLITGAGSGIGRAIAVRLDAEDFALTLVGRRGAALEETAALLNGDATVAPADVTDEAQLGAAFDTGVEAHGPLFALVANAGTGGPNEPGETDRFDELVATNLIGTYHSMRLAEARFGGSPVSPYRIVAIASILARIGVPGYSGYCASKAGVLGLVRAMAHELAPKNVLVNAICPGWVATDMAWEGLDGMAEAMGKTREEAHAIAMRDVPLGRMGEPAEIAGWVAWLLGRDSQGATGAAFDVNGGAWMG